MLTEESQIRAFTFFALLITFTFASNCLVFVGPEFDKETTRAVDGKIEKDTLYKGIDDMCAELPIPRGFELLGKRGLYNSNGTSYYYKSSAEVADIMNRFGKHFESNKWHLDYDQPLSNGVAWRKNGFKVVISFEQEYADFVVDCFSL